MGKLKHIATFKLRLRENGVAVKRKSQGLVLKQDHENRESPFKLQGWRQ